MSTKELAQKLKNLRKRKGYSQETLSEDSGLSLRTIQRIENGETNPTGETLRRLADALNVTPDELIDWTIKEDTAFLQAMNLSALTFIIFPVLGIVVPSIIWLSKKDKITGINKTAKELINFEITWIFLLIGLPVLANLLILAIYGASSWAIIFTTTIILIVILYLYNIIQIIVNTIKIHKNKEVTYFPTINFLKN